MGACFFGCLPPLPLACFLAPIPPTPFPAGRGRLRLSHARGFAPCIPGVGWDAALGLLVESGLRRGACPGGTGAWWALMRPAGACFLCRLPTLPLAFDSAPIPPDPLPLRGRGRFFVFLCKGLRPLHPRGWEGCGTGFACGKRVVAVGLPFWLPAAPAFSLLCCPPSPKGKDIPPTRARRALFPSGEGGDF